MRNNLKLNYYHKITHTLLFLYFATKFECGSLKIEEIHLYEYVYRLLKRVMKNDLLSHYITANSLCFQDDLNL